MKVTAYFIALAIIVVVAIPYLVTSNYSEPYEIKQNYELKNDTVKESSDEMNISVYLTEEKKTIEIPLEEYVICVVACEMPAYFEVDALKAQAVAARTYGIAKQGTLCNTVHCQVFKPEADIKSEKGEKWVDTYWDKIVSAVKDTEGQVMYYDGEICKQAMFHSSSGGKTENSEDIFVSAVPYLRSVDSDYEDGATHTNDQNIYTISQFMKSINAIEGIKTVTEDDIKKMKIKERSDGGSVSLVEIGENEITGKQLKSIFEISSLNFSFKVNNNKVIITSVGFGHGVGMSQYGANGMAKKGYDYKRILKHYYSGIEIKKIDENN